MTDWTVGDLAVCVDAAERHCSEDAPLVLSAGATYRVAEFKQSHNFATGAVPALRLVGVVRPKPTSFFAADRFRKIRPDEHKSCEPEFVTLLKRTKVTA